MATGAAVIVRFPRVWQQDPERGLIGSVRILEVTGSRVPDTMRQYSRNLPLGARKLDPWVHPQKKRSCPEIGTPMFFSIPSKDNRDGGGTPSQKSPREGQVDSWIRVGKWNLAAKKGWV